MTMTRAPRGNPNMGSQPPQGEAAGYGDRDSRGEYAVRGATPAISRND
ncbi:MAG: hypothetical protein V6Z86_09185 [Hyphomicrobiales bacterium]